MGEHDTEGKEKPKEASPLVSYGIYGAAGAQLAMGTVGFLLLGHYLDGRFGTSPWLSVLGLVLGFGGGLANLIHIVRRFYR